ncbi:hypothetical protein [Oceanobacillus damuensis]|uniref:hypothetical protein n=1 Tax=Oceanobacillus damuensis TaxID=937928 RepID=UPI000829C1CD|nr:hypothetical protein [Oceanobacillus damuensis]
MSKKLIHLVNITLGVLVFGGITLLVTWVYLSVGTIRGIPIGYPVLLILFSIWSIFYLLQLKFLSTKFFLLFILVEIALFIFIYTQLSSQFTITILREN